MRDRDAPLKYISLAPSACNAAGETKARETLSARYRIVQAIRLGFTFAIAAYAVFLLVH